MNGNIILNSVIVKKFGARLDGITDDTLALRQAINSDETISILSSVLAVSESWQRDGGTNHFSHVHVWGYLEPQYRPKYAFSTAGKTSINQCYLDSFAVAVI